MSQPREIPFMPVVPWEADVKVYAMHGPALAAMEFNGWREEVRSWKDGAYLGAALSCTTPIFAIKGPEAERFFSDHFVNNFATMPVGGFRHGIMCDDKGRIMQDGVVLRLADDEFYTTWLDPYIGYVFSKGGYAATGTSLTGQRFFFQVAGPRSLEILERATGTDLHDIQFGQHRTATIAAAEVRVFRLGMAGSLAYEVHGEMPYGQAIYEGIWEAGRDLGLQKLGLVSYMLNHTEDGFPQAYLHFPYPWYEDPDFAEYLHGHPGLGFLMWRPRLFGSLGDDIQKRFVTPFDTGWENRIYWDHEFVGKQALQEIAKSPKRTVVTLEWNADDVADVYASQFRGESADPYEPISDRPNDMRYDFGVMDQATGQPRAYAYHADRVLKDGHEIGFSSGRAVSQTYHRMISLGFISRDQAAPGNEVVVIWGGPDYPQKQIRATVARFPYLREVRNDQIDVGTIPRLPSESAE